MWSDKVTSVEREDLQSNIKTFNSRTEEIKTLRQEIDKKLIEIKKIKSDVGFKGSKEIESLE